MKLFILILAIVAFIILDRLAVYAKRNNTTLLAILIKLIEKGNHRKDTTLEKKEGKKMTLTKIISPLIILLGIGTIWGAFYTIEPDENGVVIRLGKVIEQTGPGIHFKIPFIEDVKKVKTEIVHQAEFGFRTKNASSQRTEYDESQSYEAESKMLTGDLNVVKVEWTVQYKISNPVNYLFSTQDPEENIYDVSESVLRRLVGDRLVSDILTTGRTEIASEAKVLIQKILDSYDQGILIVGVQPQDINPPDPVKPSFNDVNNAKQEQDRMINQAEQNYNKIIPEAEGKAIADIETAKGSSLEKINRAKGDILKFNKVYKEYKNAPLITKKRMYLDTMKAILKGKKIILVEQNMKNSVYPIYNLNKKGEK